MRIEGEIANAKTDISRARAQIAEMNAQITAQRQTLLTEVGHFEQAKGLLMIRVLGKEYTKDQANDLVKKYFVWFLVAIYPTSVLFIKHSFSLAMLVMMICGSVILFRDRKEGQLSDHACEILF